MLADNKLIVNELLDGRSSSESLLPAISAMMQKVGKTINDIETVAVCVGPGSFTGSRVALATAFGIIYGREGSENECKLISYSLFDLLGDEGIVSCVGGFYISEDFKQFFNKEPKYLNSFDFDEAGKKNIDLFEREFAVVAEKIENKDYTKIASCQPMYLQYSQAENELVKKMVFSSVRSSDIDTVMSIEEKSFDAGDAFSRRVMENSLRINHYYCAKLGGKMVGYVGLTKAKDDSDVIRVAIAEEYRRMGVARTLFEFALRQLKPKFVFLEVRKNNEAALRLYKSLGFVQTGERVNYYKDGCAAVMMKLKV